MEVYARGNLGLIDELIDVDIQEHEDIGDQKPAGRNGLKDLVEVGIEPSGRRIFFTSMDEIRFEDGKIKEHWGVSDTMGLMLQLGGLGAHVEYPGGSSLYLDG